MITNSNISKEPINNEENLYSFRDFIPKIKVTRGNDRHIHASSSVKRKFDKYFKANGAYTQSHALHMLLEENKILRQICSKVAVGIRRAHEDNNVNFLIRVFAELATPEEKRYYDAILKGIFD